MLKKIFSSAGIVAVLLGCLFFLSSLLKDEHVSGTSISGVVVPHHNLVADIRAEFFETLASKITPPKTIILVSPNHYHAGKGAIQTTSQDWSLEDGTLQPNSDVIETLLESGLVSNEPLSFRGEHGIFNILGDIHDNFPNTQVVPLILEDISLARVEELKRVLHTSCNECLMIASVDFSHYQPALLADLHDAQSIRYLQTLDVSNLHSTAEVDSGSTLALLALWAKEYDTLHFSLEEHTNSGILYENPDIETTTHVFGWYESGGKIEPVSEVSFIIGGDMMFGRYIHRLFKNDFDAAFDQLGDRVFWGTDAAVINLEGTITNLPFEENLQPDNLTFKFSPDIVPTLSWLRINGASLANNHSNNAGTEGVETTRALLGAAAIQTFGGATEKDVVHTATFHGHNLKLTVIGINLTFPGQTPDPAVPLIQELKKDPQMRVIVMPHWGEEYELIHNSSQAAAAYMWVDAGADMVVGSHPHVIQDMEVYKNVPIIYSLGNLLFDQDMPYTDEGLLVAGKFSEGGVTFFGLPVKSVRYKPQLLTGSRKQEILEALYEPAHDYVVQTPAGDIMSIQK